MNPAHIQITIARGPVSDEWLELIEMLPEASMMGDVTISGKKIKAPKIIGVFGFNQEISIPEMKGDVVVVYRQGYGGHRCNTSCQNLYCDPDCEEWGRMIIKSSLKIITLPFSTQK